MMRIEIAGLIVIVIMLAINAFYGISRYNILVLAASQKNGKTDVTTNNAEKNNQKLDNQDKEKKPRKRYYMYKVEQVANYFIERGLEEQNPVNPMKLQKLLYYAYGWYYAFFGKKLFDDQIQARKYGPVVEKIYHDVKHYGNYPITTTISNYLIGEGDSMFSFKLDTPKLNLEKDSEEYKFLDAMWKVYSKYSAIQLSNTTHSDGTPWDTISKKHNLNNENNIAIDNETIKEYFINEKKKMEERKNVNS